MNFVKQVWQTQIVVGIECRDRDVDQINGFNFTMWRGDESNYSKVSGISFGTMPEAGYLYGLNIGILGPAAQREMSGINIGILGGGSGGDIKGIGLGGLG